MAGLLANNHKFLIQTCVKGVKGGEFRHLTGWYALVINNMSHLINLMLQDNVGNDQIVRTFNILRCGLFSRSQDVANVSCRFFTKLRLQLGENIETPQVQNLVHVLWDWLNVPQNTQGAQ